MLPHGVEQSKILSCTELRLLNQCGKKFDLSNFLNEGQHCSPSKVFLKSATQTLFGAPWGNFLKGSICCSLRRDWHMERNCSTCIWHILQKATEENLHFFLPSMISRELQTSSGASALKAIWNGKFAITRTCSLSISPIFAQTKVILLFHYGQSEIIQFAELTIWVYFKLYNSHVHIWNNSNSNRENGAIFVSLGFLSLPLSNTPWPLMRQMPTCHMGSSAWHPWKANRRCLCHKNCIVSFREMYSHYFYHFNWKTSLHNTSSQTNL